MQRKIAVPINDNGVLDAHFGHCRYFAILTTEKSTILSEEKLTPPPHEPGLLPRWLADMGVTDIIAGGMGQRAIQIFNSSGINAFVGAPVMSARKLVQGFLEDNIQFAANYCDH